MTNQRAPRFIALLTESDPSESRRAQLMTKAFWSASATGQLAEVIDLSASRSSEMATPHASR
jgi:hypothetical protein